MTDDVQPRYRSRGDDPVAARQAIKRLLRSLAKLAQETDPTTGQDTTRKDARAFQALSAAGQLVDAVAGWAIDHSVGLALSEMSYVPAQPSGTAEHPDYLAQRERADSHEHELAGTLYEHELVNDEFGSALLTAMKPTSPGVERLALHNVLYGLHHAYPSSLFSSVIEGLRALEFGEVHPIFAPATGNRKRKYNEKRWQLRALALVEYRFHLGMRKKAAQDEVAAVYCCGSETLRTWERRLREELGQLEVSRTLSFAQNAASHVMAEKKGHVVGHAYRSHFEAAYGEAALRSAAAAYREALDA